MITYVDLSFDDGLVAQLKWARVMNALGLRGTFYVCPGLLGQEGYLTEAQLETLALYGHRIANHTWEHEHPARCSVVEVLKGLDKARQWLDARGYAGSVLALPKGSRSGGWGPAAVETLTRLGYVGMRDVRFSGEATDVFAPRVSALETTDVFAIGIGLNAFYHHDNRNTNDAELSVFLTTVAQWCRNGVVECVLANGMGETEWHRQ